VDRLEQIDRLERIRISSIEPTTIPHALIKKMAQKTKLCRHLHIPIQSGDDKILKKMRRKYSREDYIVLIRKIKKHVPGVAITTDCLVGFPGEDEASFESSLRFIEQVEFSDGHVFTYSPRAGTPAYRLPGRAAAPVLRVRRQRMLHKLEVSAKAFRTRFLGTVMPVLWEGKPGRGDAWRRYRGLTDNYLRVETCSPLSLAGTITVVRLLFDAEAVLYGEVEARPPQDLIHSPSGKAL